MSVPEKVLLAVLRWPEINDAGEGGHRWELDPGPGERVQQENGRASIEHEEPAMGRAEAATPAGFGEVETVDPVVGEAEEAADAVFDHVGQRYAGELRWEVLGLGRHPPRRADGAKCDVIGDSGQAIRDAHQQIHWKLGPLG